MEVDLRAVRVVAKRSTAPRVSAMTEDDIAGSIDLAKGELSPPLRELAAQMVDLMASQNKGGSVSLGRVLREVYAPLSKAAMSSDYAVSALEYGMEQAIAKGVPNVNYAKKAAGSFGESVAVATPAITDRYRTIGGEGHE
jgi:hypothetical protein